MSDNPFEAPLSDLNSDDETRIATKNGRVWVDNNRLVVRSGTILPLVCIKTNEPISEADLKKKTMTWLNPLFGLLMLLGGPLLIIAVYLLARKTCVLTYGISPAIRRQYRKRMLIHIAVTLLLILALFIAASFESAPGIVIAVSSLLVSVILMLFIHSPLRIRKFRNDEFWISGCSKEFLARFVQ